MNIYLENDALDNAVYDDFPVVSFQIMETNEIDRILDGIRREKGYHPFFFANNEDELNTDGYYDVYLDVDLLKKKVVSIYGEVHADYEEDDYQIYFLSFDNDDVIKRLDLQLNKFGTNMEMLYDMEIEHWR